MITDMAFIALGSLLILFAIGQMKRISATRHIPAFFMLAAALCCYALVMTTLKSVIVWLAVTSLIGMTRVLLSGFDRRTNRAEPKSM